MITTPATARSPFEIMRLLVEAGIDSRLADVLVSPATRFVDLTVQLRAEAARLSARMLELTERLDNGAIINSLGEVQSRGADIDRLCALRAASTDDIRRSAYVLRESLERPDLAEVLLSVFTFR